MVTGQHRARRGARGSDGGPRLDPPRSPRDRWLPRHYSIERAVRLSEMGCFPEALRGGVGGRAAPCEPPHAHPPSLPTGAPRHWGAATTRGPQAPMLAPIWWHAHEGLTWGSCWERKPSQSHWPASVLSTLRWTSSSCQWFGNCIPNS